MGASIATIRVVTGYYAATVLFVILDYLFDFNIRLMFLDPWPAWRAAYYAPDGRVTSARPNPC